MAEQREWEVGPGDGCHTPWKTKLGRGEKGEEIQKDEEGKGWAAERKE